MVMDEVRMGQIALLALKSRMREEKLRLGPNLRREVGKRAKELGIPFKEAWEFVEHVIRELVEETFAQPQPKCD